MAKLILAWDKNTFDKTDEYLLQRLKPYIDVIKVGLQAMTAFADGICVAYQICRFAASIGLEVMWDAKLNDIPNTIGEAAENIVKNVPNVTMFTTHASAGTPALRAAWQATTNTDVVALAVTILTSFNDATCAPIFGGSVEEKVRYFADMALGASITGLVCAPQELRLLHKTKFIGPGLIEQLVTPGIRPLWAQQNDQARSMTPGEAVRLGATHLVIGRPILKPPRDMTSIEAAQSIKEEMATA